MTITMTSDHLRKGAPRSARYCAVALALRDAGVPGAECGTTTYTYMRGFRVICNPLPENARLFIHAFDRKAQVDLITFDIPEPT